MNGTFDREQAESAVRAYDAKFDTVEAPSLYPGEPGEWMTQLLDELEQCVLPQHGWAVILENLAEVYPEAIFPLQHTAADDGNGPQVISLIRLLRQREDALAAAATGITLTREEALLTARCARSFRGDRPERADLTLPWSDPAAVYEHLKQLAEKLEAAL